MWHNNSSDQLWLQRVLSNFTATIVAANGLSFPAPHVFRTLPSSDLSSAAGTLRGVFPEGLPFDFHAGARAAFGRGRKPSGLISFRPPTLVTLPRWTGRRYTGGQRATRKRPIFVGITEAVFSSSGDRIRAIQAKAAVAGPSIASKALDPVLTDPALVDPG